MNDLPPKIASESNSDPNQAQENIETNMASPEVATSASGGIVRVTATLSSDNSFITVDWHPHVIYSSLTRVNQSTGDVETLLGAYDSEFPTYSDDWNLVNGNSYVYELFVPGNPRSPFRSPSRVPNQTWLPILTQPGSEHPPIDATKLTTNPAEAKLPSSAQSGSTPTEQAEK